jgi:hypothetical protein
MHLGRGFGRPQGQGFYSTQLGRPPEEVLLKAFPRLAYDRDLGRTTLKHFLNWPAKREPSSLNVSQRFHDVWTRGAGACA